MPTAVSEISARSNFFFWTCGFRRANAAENVPYLYRYLRHWTEQQMNTAAVEGGFKRRQHCFWTVRTPKRRLAGCLIEPHAGYGVAVAVLNSAKLSLVPNWIKNSFALGQVAILKHIHVLVDSERGRRDILEKIWESGNRRGVNNVFKDKAQPQCVTHLPGRLPLSEQTMLADN